MRRSRNPRPSTWSAVPAAAQADGEATETSVLGDAQSERLRNAFSLREETPMSLMTVLLVVLVVLFLTGGGFYWRRRNG